MSEFRKTIIISVAISLVVGGASGLAGGIVVTQIAAGNLGQSLRTSLPSSLQWIVPRNFPLPQPSPTRGEGVKVDSSPLGRGGGGGRNGIGERRSGEGGGGVGAA